jgi:hypothetical protein
MNVSVHCRRIKLNQPYLIRGSLDRRFAYSREVCLRSARAVIHVKRLLEKEKSSFGSTHQRLFMIIHHLFLATIVLVMDLCFNRIEGHEEQRRVEVMDACKMLEDCKEQSDVAEKFLESLKDVLRKHKILPPSSFIDSTSAKESSVAGTSMLRNESTECTRHPDNLDPSEGITLNIDIDFFQTWQNYIDSGQNLDMPHWDHLFSDLDSHGA